MSPRRSSLWVEIAVALALVAVTTIVLNAGVFWLLLKRAEEQRRTDLALALTDGLVAQLEVALAQGGVDGPRPAEILAAYDDSPLQFDALYVVARDMTPLHVRVGEPPSTPDPGLRAALFGRDRDVSVRGVLWGQRSVEVTAPVALRGTSAAALRVRLPLASPVVTGGPAPFVLIYTASSGLALAAFGFSLLRRRLLVPIRGIQAATERIAEGDFGHTAQVDAARELEALCASLNTMSQALAGYRSATAEQLARLQAANSELQAAQAALVQSEKLAGVGRLAAGVAHEVGNPLAAVLGYVELLEQVHDDPTLQTDLLGRSRRELQRIHRIIRALLDHAHAGTGVVQRVAVSAAVADARSTVAATPRAKHVEIDVAEGVLETVCAVELDPDRLQQVLVNVLLNAADAVAEVASPQVRVSLEEAGGEVGVVVTDSGPGFDPVALERALEPFFTTKEPGAGTGLGLSTSEQIVAAAGGRIALSNGPLGGARVTVWLPRSGAS